jgi:ABC-type molybdenum transport system ATPase subunit/photorepair protein PhrA
MTRFLWRRLHSTCSTVLHLPRVNVYKFGDGDAARPVFKDFKWTIRDGENWAVVGASSKSSMIQVSRVQFILGSGWIKHKLLTGELRISPPPLSGLYPFLRGRDIYEAVSLVSFATRLDTSGGGAFYDFTARYGALRDGDKTTLRESLEGSSSLEQLNTLAVELNLDNLLHLPLVALSNGQTRRARILTALLRSPKLLILDEPFSESFSSISPPLLMHRYEAGLDAQHRPRLSNLLHKLHQKQSPRVIIALRPQDPLPEWITHVLALSSADDVQHGSVREMRHVLEKLANPAQAEIKASQQNASDTGGDEYVSMKNVTVAYHGRVVCPLVRNSFFLVTSVLGTGQS